MAKMDSRVNLIQKRLASPVSLLLLLLLWLWMAAIDDLEEEVKVLLAQWGLNEIEGLRFSSEVLMIGLRRNHRMRINQISISTITKTPMPLSLSLVVFVLQSTQWMRRRKRRLLLLLLGSMGSAVTSQFGPSPTWSTLARNKLGNARCTSILCE